VHRSTKPCTACKTLIHQQQQQQTQPEDDKKTKPPGVIIRRQGEVNENCNQAACSNGLCLRVPQHRECCGKVKICQQSGIWHGRTGNFGGFKPAISSTIMCEADGTKFRLDGYKTQAARSVGERCRMYARFPALSVCSSSLFCRADGRLHKY
jgi:hypothetical protein